MKLAIRIGDGAQRIVAHPQGPGFVERRAQPVRIEVRGRGVLRRRARPEQVLGQEIDALVHLVHDQRLHGVRGRRAWNERHRCARHLGVVQVRLSRRGRHGDGVLQVGKDLAHGADRDVDLAGLRLGEVPNVVQVGDALEQEGIRAAGA